MGAGKVCAHCVMAGICPCFLDVSSPNLNGTAPFTPMRNLENRLHAHTHTQVTIGLCAGPARPRARFARARLLDPTASYGQPKQKQQAQQQLTRSSSSSGAWAQGALHQNCHKPSQTLDPSPCGSCPAPKNRFINTKKVTIGHTTKHVL